MSDVTARAPIATLVNTHANGDHCYGNELVSGADIIASTAAAEEMAEVPAALMDALLRTEGDVGELFRSFFGDFDFGGISGRPPTTTFDGRMSVDVGGRAVELIEVGPAHTKGDVIVHVPDARTVFTGDILFSGATPIVWAGPMANWIAACDLIATLDVETVVPGHGPVTDLRGVAACRDYLSFIEEQASDCFAEGLDPFEAAQEIVTNGLGVAGFDGWGERGRVAVNVEAVYRQLDPTHRSPDVVEQFRRMRRLERVETE
jgi:glyoxylase-like metal-dependent hydrolase (beta-lactamase superfamily II)